MQRMMKKEKEEKVLSPIKSASTIKKGSRSNTNKANKTKNKYFIFSSGVVLFVMGEVIYNYFSKQ